MRKVSIAVCLLTFAVAFAFDANAQKRTLLGKVCGDPTQACRTRENFQDYELPFEYGKNVIISQSQLFYAVILKSVKLNADQSNCDKAIPESDRTETQALFPRNMVFVMRCWESGQASYSNVADGVSFMAVYAGRTVAEANAFLIKVKAIKRYKQATMRKMRVEINGT
jgi:hypothetical protein